MFFRLFRRLGLRIGSYLSAIWWFPRDLFIFFKQSPAGVILRLFPVLGDHGADSHTFDKHYVYMDRWAFEHINKRKPVEHVDVGSSNVFVSMASVITHVIYIDLRPSALRLPSLEFRVGNITKLPFHDRSIASLSCLHVAEHVGLGRYGDDVDYHGTRLACLELSRVLSRDGCLYFAVPVGKSRVYFNAHRVHTPSQILSYFPELVLKEFSVVDDRGQFIRDADPVDYAESDYACGMFVFTRTV